MKSSQTQLFAVTGNPIIHSKSPGMFTSCFQKHNVDAAYFRLAATSAQQAIFMCKHMKLSGMNVTAPFKEKMLKLVDVVHDEAKIIGSINTIVVKNGMLHGHNTDYFGVTQSFADMGISVKGKSCVIIGAGGAGKAAAYGLQKEGAHLTIVNRTIEKAQKLAKKLSCNFAPLSELKQILASHTIIISALHQNINPIKKEWITKSHIIFDANYTTSELVQWGKEKKCTVVSAEQWLVNQAMLAYSLFFGYMPHKKSLENGLAMNTITKKSHTISTIGLMGAGKTSHGKILAEKLNYMFKDIDEAIIEKEQKSIVAIFNEHGEEYFRTLEMQELAQSFNSPKPHILSCGGGIVTHQKNRELLQKNSLVLWLFATPKAIIERVDISKRPLLQVKNPEKKLQELYEVRKGMYAKTADIVFSTEEEIKLKNTNQIIAELKHIGLCNE